MAWSGMLLRGRGVGWGDRGWGWGPRDVGVGENGRRWGGGRGDKGCSKATWFRLDAPMHSQVDGEQWVRTQGGGGERQYGRGLGLH